MSRKAIRGYKRLQQRSIDWVHSYYEAIDNGNTGASTAMAGIAANAEITHAISAVLMAASRITKLRSLTGWVELCRKDMVKAMEALEQHAPKVVQPKRGRQ